MKTYTITLIPQTDEGGEDYFEARVVEFPDVRVYAEFEEMVFHELVDVIFDLENFKCPLNSLERV